MNFIIIEPKTFFLILIIFLAISIQFAIITKLLKTLKDWLQKNSLDLMEIYSVSGFLRTLNKKVENSRKRDERMLREIHKVDKNAETRFKLTGDFNTALSEVLAGIAKQGRTLDTLCHTGNKDQQEIKTRLTHIRKDLDKAGNILSLFEKIVVKSQNDTIKRNKD